MRRENLWDVKSYQAAKKLAPWASIIAKCEGGYIAFESKADYRTWKRQK